MAPKRRMKKRSLPKENLGTWEIIMSDIKAGAVVPIISNSFRVEHIFRDEIFCDEDDVSEKVAEISPVDDENFTIDEELTEVWADNIGYPMPDNHNLARVAQYYLIQKEDNYSAKRQYLYFLKDYFLSYLLADEKCKDLASKLEIQAEGMKFSEIVSQMDFPRFDPNSEDPLRLLAKLPLPLYITTSYYDFLERALLLEGKHPITQICFWNKAKSNVKPEHITDPNYEPLFNHPDEPPSNHPVVYHLYGLEDYPQTLVLSEDDFMNFLVSVAKDTDTQNPMVPLRLQQALAGSALLLLGYQLRDWDFRILFRFISSYREEEHPLSDSPRGMVIQLRQSQIEGNKKSLDYMRRYFESKKFDVEWTSADCFIQKLWDSYNRGQS